jgi:hypothetical protein
MFVTTALKNSHLLQKPNLWATGCDDNIANSMEDAFHLQKKKVTIA